LLLNNAAQHFVGTHDFKALCPAGHQKKYRKDNKNFNVKKQDDLILFCVYADGFLYNMVRIMAGTLLEIAGGRIYLLKLLIL
jgi:tRNA pseudouridine38-40 synthase